MNRLSSSLVSTLGNLRPRLPFAKSLLMWLVSLGSGAVAFIRSASIWPAILGDEYVYSLNARHAEPADPLVGATSNTIYNFAYSLTSVCGPDFYTCTKALNSVFFALFVVIVMLVAIRFVGYWQTIVIGASIGLSSLSVYTSLFLPESMFFAFMAAFILFVTSAIERMQPGAWITAGIALGLASLVKPHAWFGLGAVAIFGIVYSIFNSRSVLNVLKLGGLMAISAVGTRLLIALFFGSNDLFRIFGQYFDQGNIEEIVGTGIPDGANPVSSMGEYVADIALNQIGVTFSLLLLPIASVVAYLLGTLRQGVRSTSPLANYATLMLVWLGFMIVAITLFQAYVTAQGDDHNARVVLRYYEYLIPFVWIAAMAAANELSQRSVSPWIRWPIFIGALGLLNWVFIDFYRTVQIQIADAPSVAGLIGSQLGTSIMWGVVPFALLVFGVFPRFFAHALLVSLTAISISLGLGTFEQYEIARGQQSDADRAGLYLRSNMSEVAADLTILATSRFDATLAAFWVDNPDANYEIVPPGTFSLDTWPSEMDKNFLVVGSDIVLVDGVSVYQGDGFTVYRRD